MGEPGEIYVLVNPAMPGLVKVGKTRSESARRASQLWGVQHTDRICWHSSTMTFLKLLAGAAGARIIPADLSSE